ncbi:hypothetical protein AAIH69_13465 [Paenibacillus sp. MABNS29]|uniref:hypothetical protein n=1 Tax=Paenibacillus sp. MABNS29 TaxID=3142627 RepID=UPI003D29E18B
MKEILKKMRVTYLSIVRSILVFLEFISILYTGILIMFKKFQIRYLVYNLKYRIRIIKIKVNYKISAIKLFPWIFRRKYRILIAIALFIIAYICTWYGAYGFGKFLTSVLQNFKVGLSFYYNISNLVQLLKPYIIKIIPIAMPVSLTFFYFIYKEQKTLAMSNTFWNKPTFYFVLSSLLAIITAINVNKEIVINNPMIFVGNNLLFFLIIIMVLTNGLQAIFRHLDSLSIITQLESATKRFESSIAALMLVKQKNEKFSYKNLNNSVESIYQLFFLALDKNMSNSYYEYMLKWEKVLSTFKDEPIQFAATDRRSDDIVLQINKNTSYFQGLFRAILKNQITLIIKLIQGSKIEDAQRSLKLFHNLCPSEDLLRVEFYTSLHELAVLCYKQDFLEPILHELPILQQYENSKNKQRGKNDVNLIFEKLLIMSVLKNDVKSISSISYSAVQNFPMIKKKKNSDKLFLPDPFPNNSNKEDINSVLYMLFLSLIKSIELSHYSTSGFLIKFIVTNFDGGIIKKVFGELLTNVIKNGVYENPSVPNSSRIETTFNLNKKTVRYCTEKMSVLLYCQQRYAFEKNISFNSALFLRPFVVIDEAKKIHYFEYIINKLENAKDKYGLYFLKDNDFFEKMKLEFKK